MPSKISPLSSVIANTATGVKAELATAGDDIAVQAKDIADQAREALEQMQQILNTFAAQTGQSLGEAGDAAKTAASHSGDLIGSMASDIKANGEQSLDALAATVSRHPFGAVAAAAGVGLLLGLLSRPGAR